MQNTNATTNEAVKERDRNLFDTIAKDYAAKDIYSPCRRARKRRLDRTLELSGMGNGIHILEVGCGAGFTAEYAQGRYSRYLGIDYSGELIECAKIHNKQPQATFEQADFYTHEFNCQFDVIIMIGVLHHMPDIANAVKRARELLKPNGIFVAHEPQLSNPLISAMRNIRKRIDPSYSVDQRELSEKELRSLFTEAGFTSVKVCGQGYLTPPVAEVRIRPPVIGHIISVFACLFDNIVERILGKFLKPLAWDIIVFGRP